MAKYSGKTFTVNKPAQEIADKFSDLTGLQQVVDHLPAEERSKVGDIAFTADTISVKTPQVGDIRFRVIERNADNIVMKAEGTPVPMSLDIKLAPKAADVTDATCSVDVEIPAFIRPMVGPQLQKAVGMLSDMIAKVVS